MVPICSSLKIIKILRIAFLCFFRDFDLFVNIIKVLLCFLNSAFEAIVGIVKRMMNFASPQNPFGAEIINGFY